MKNIFIGLQQVLLCFSLFKYYINTNTRHSILGKAFWDVLVYDPKTLNERWESD
jgi:hypothetical protein